MKAADAAKDSAETARDALIRSRRPWLAIIEPLRIMRPLTFDAGGGSDVEVQFSVRNSGTSPALGTVLYVALGIGPMSANMDEEVGQAGCAWRSAGVRGWRPITALEQSRPCGGPKASKVPRQAILRL
jgi:hypothetical protein